VLLIVHPLLHRLVDEMRMDVFFLVGNVRIIIVTPWRGGGDIMKRTEPLILSVFDCSGGGKQKLLRFKKTR